MINREDEIKKEILKLKRELYLIKCLKILETATIKDFNWHEFSFHKQTKKKGLQTYLHTKFELRKYTSSFDRIRMSTSYSKEEIDKSPAIQNELIEKYKKYFNKKLCITK